MVCGQGFELRLDGLRLHRFGDQTLRQRRGIRRQRCHSKRGHPDPCQQHGGSTYDRTVVAGHKGLRGNSSRLKRSQWLDFRRRPAGPQAERQTQARSEAPDGTLKIRPEAACSSGGAAHKKVR